MMPESFPFTVSYEAVFERGALQYAETSTRDGETKSLTEYTDAGRRELTLAPANPYEQAIRHMISCIDTDKPTTLGIDEAAKALSIAFAVTDMLAQYIRKA